MMKIPTLLDISPTNLLSLDERGAYRNFYGKSLSEARELFDESDFYVNDLGWMGKVAFEFYVEAYIDHLSNCNLNELDIFVSMTLVKIRFAMFEDHSNLIKLMEKISDLRKASLREIDVFGKEYDEVVEKIRRGAQ
jgi:hypothetical protein